MSPFLDGGLKFQSSASTHQDMQFGDLKRMTREDVLTVFNMPPIMVGVFDEANYSNAREQRRIFWVDCIVPRLRKIESVLNERLVKPYEASLIVKYDLSGIEDLADDLDQRSRADSLNVNAGIVTINEVRKLRNLPQVPWGDTWYAPFGLAPVTLPPVGDPSAPIPDDGSDDPASQDPATDPAKALKSAQEEPAPSLPDPVLEDPKKVRRDQIWMRYKGLTERLESHWSPVMRQLFTDQEREVIAKVREMDWKKSLNQNRLDRFKNIKQTVDVILFDRNKSRTVFRKDAHRLMTYTVNASAKEQIDDNNLGIDFNITDPNVTAWVNSKSFKFAEEVNRTTEDALRDELVDAINNGDSLSQVEDRIASVFDIARGSRTAMIARTEVISASNEGAFESYKQSGLVSNVEWITSRDNKVRDEHQIDGETVGIGLNFSNGLKYPGDPAGEPGNVINCRCTISPVVDKGGE
jgi:SPP1 gp7 family putative phage head morphogenesis protein